MQGLREAVGRQWFVHAMRGICAILFGVLAIVWPVKTLMVLVILFGAYAIVSGIFTLMEASRGGLRRDARAWMVVSAVLGILAGFIAWLWPAITTLALLMLIAAYAVVIGATEVVTAFSRRKAGDTEWMYVVSGVLAIIFGILLFAWPATGALALTWLIGMYAIVYGVALLFLAIRLRGMSHRGTAGTAAHAM